MAEGVLSVAINRIVIEGLLPLGVVGWVVGGLIFVVAHGLVLGLALITVTVQALRLHYVEFYTKFYPIDEIGLIEPFEATVTMPGRSRTAKA